MQSRAPGNDQLDWAACGGSLSFTGQGKLMQRWETQTHEACASTFGTDLGTCYHLPRMCDTLQNGYHRRVKLNDAGRL
jgi:hypothetical protein